MAPGEYAAFLTELLNAEHDRMRLLSAYLQELDVGSLEWDAIQSLQLNEIRPQLRRPRRAAARGGGDATPAVGRFYGRGLALGERNERFGFLRHIREWLAARLAAGLPRVPPRARQRAAGDARLAPFRAALNVSRRARYSAGNRAGSPR